MSLSILAKLTLEAPRPKNSTISRVESSPCNICLSILSHFAVRLLADRNRNPKQSLSSWCNGCFYRKRWTALKIHPPPWCQGKRDLAGHAGSSSVWYSTHFQQPHTLTRYMSTPVSQPPFPKRILAACANKVYFLRVVSIGFVFTAPCMTLPFSAANVHLSQASSVFPNPLHRACEESLYPLTLPGSGTLWAPWQESGSNLTHQRLNSSNVSDQSLAWLLLMFGRK